MSMRRSTDPVTDPTLYILKKEQLTSPQASHHASRDVQAEVEAPSMLLKRSASFEGTVVEGARIKEGQLCLEAVQVAAPVSGLWW